MHLRRPAALAAACSSHSRSRVTHRGRVVERGPTAQVLDAPQDDYTKRLRASVPRPGWKPQRRQREVPV